MLNDVRRSILVAVASQHGLVTHSQVARLHGDAATAQGISELEAAGDLTRVIGETWAHAAVVPPPQSVQEARALWILTKPAELLRDRRSEYLAGGQPVPVLGGAAAFEHWGLAWAPNDSTLTMPTVDHEPLERSDFVTVRTCEDDWPHDVDWQADDFPHHGVEATLVDGLREGLGLDRVAELLREAMWRHHPLSSERLFLHLTSFGREERWDAHSVEAEYVEMVARAGGWPGQPGSPRDGLWRTNRSEVERMLATDAADRESDPDRYAARSRDRTEQLREIYEDRRAARVDATVAVRLRAQRTQRDLRGSSLSSDAAAEALHLTGTALSEAWRRGDFHAYETDNGPVFPDWQIGVTGSIPHLREILDAVPRGMHPSTLRGFMTTPQFDMVIDGAQTSPRTWVLAGREAGPIVDRLRALAHR